MDEATVHQLAATLSCKVGSFPGAYLGLLLCSGKAGKSIWNPLVERVEKRLSVWNAKYLSLGGRITLTKAVLSSLSVYYLSVLKCPASFASRIEKLGRDFLWQTGGPERKFRLCCVSSPKSVRSLRFRPIR